MGGHGVYIDELKTNREREEKIDSCAFLFDSRMETKWN
jgi:hypothetical protein